MDDTATIMQRVQERLVAYQGTLGDNYTLQINEQRVDTQTDKPIDVKKVFEENKLEVLFKKGGGRVKMTGNGCEIKAEVWLNVDGLRTTTPFDIGVAVLSLFHVLREKELFRDREV